MTESSSKFDLIIIGAGINGAGIARDAALRGLSVLLLDKGDIGSGTSSFSTRLIHGGLRYLEHGEFGLVRESLREREILLRIASHLVCAIPILIPIYKSGSRSRTTIKTGMIAYDLLSWGKSVPSYQMLSTAKTLERCPGLKPCDLSGAAVYYDCQVEFAERLVLANALAAKQAGAQITTYARVISIEGNGVRFIFEGKEEIATADVIVNASGPWVDELIGSNASRLIGGTKGSHLVIGPFKGAPEMAVYMEAESDHRPIFVIPWNGAYLIGTTDVRFEGSLDEVRTELWEVDYLLDETNRVFPEAALGRTDVRYTYSGVRPLPFTEKESERRITRRHFSREHPSNENLLSIVGGKLTTYRSLAEDCVDLVFKKLGQSSPRCITHEMALPGAVELIQLNEAVGQVEFTTEQTRRLSRIYGAKVSRLREMSSENPELAQSFNKSGNAIAAEIVYSFESELAQTLSDCLLRRTMIGLSLDLGIGDDEAAANVARRWLGWSEERVRNEVKEYRKHIAAMRVKV